MDVWHLVFLGFAAACGGLAWGYRGQRDIQREQVTFLRAQGGYTPPPAAEQRQDRNQSRAVTTFKGAV